MPELWPTVETPEQVGIRSVQHVPDDARLGKSNLARALPYETVRVGRQQRLEWGGRRNRGESTSEAQTPRIGIRDGMHGETAEHAADADAVEGAACNEWETRRESREEAGFEDVLSRREMRAHTPLSPQPVAEVDRGADERDVRLGPVGADDQGATPQASRGGPDRRDAVERARVDPHSERDRVVEQVVQQGAGAYQPHKGGSRPTGGIHPDRNLTLPHRRAQK